MSHGSAAKKPVRPRLCVFCGKPPEDKNKEHVLPQWLIEMTGDPNRVVQLGHDYHADKPIRFAWKSLVMPACASCNSEFGRGLEERVKPIMRRLLTHDALSVADYTLLLDWLDKVRVGLWLNYQVIQNFHSGVAPRFHIRDRIGAKDRMLAVYPIGEQPHGLNVPGVETLLFHHTPCCFGLRVNDLLIINMSGDFLFAERCGFPTPTRIAYLVDGPYAGGMPCSDFVATRKTKRRLFVPKLIKPAVQLYQPILFRHPANRVEFLGKPSKTDPFFATHVTDWTSGKGVLLRQLDRHVTKLKDPAELVAFDSVVGKARRPAGHITAQVYDLQCIITERQRHVANDPKKLATLQKRLARMRAINRRYADAFRQTSGPKWW